MLAVLSHIEHKIGNIPHQRGSPVTPSAAAGLRYPSRFFVPARTHIDRTLIAHSGTCDDTSFPRAIREIMGTSIQHRTNTDLNHRLEQDHRGIKPRSSPMRGLGRFEAAARFCRAVDALRTYLLPCHTMGEVISLQEQRLAFLQRLATLQTVIQAV